VSIRWEAVSRGEDFAIKAGRVGAGMWAELNPILQKNGCKFFQSSNLDPLRLLRYR
jgi:hypothetical protein